ncbi:MAG: SapB/AmfS family lanthipeptide [Streptosporangiaceae bacterium]|jgi:hypothetical protein
MAILDMQDMQSRERWGGGPGGGSDFSLLLCDSTLSTLLCV